jgi:hypothetical protein
MTTRGWSKKKKKNQRLHHCQRKRWHFGSLMRCFVGGVAALILLQQYFLVLTVRQEVRSRTNHDFYYGAPPPGMKFAAGSETTSTNNTHYGEELPLSSSSSPPPSQTSHDARNHDRKFLIFRHVFTGQGAGNVLSGLLATHLLAVEFNRTVCVDYPSFQRVFSYEDNAMTHLCESIQERHPPNDGNTIQRNNYDQSGFSSECSLKDRLESEDTADRFLYYTGNTYPRWVGGGINGTNSHAAAEEEGDYLHRYYRPTPALLQILPWPSLPTSTTQQQPQPPHTVVHLRQADGDLDPRPGLDDITLKTLGEALRSGNQNNNSNNVPYLVTNRVEWYDYFETHHGWAHPPWSQVQHSALHIAWGGQHRTNDASGSSSNSKIEQELQLWADWYTLVRATHIYHTPSDFSKSAARWNTNIVSWTIRGTHNVTTNTNSNISDGRPQEQQPSFPTTSLALERDFEEDHGVLPLVARRQWPVLDQLKYCNQTKNTIPQEYKESRMANMLAMAKRRRKAFGF